MNFLKHSNNTNPRKPRIKELLELSKQINALRNQTTDEELLRDYAIYIRDIRKFLGAAPSKTAEEIQVYIVDYRAVIEHANKAASIPKKAQG